MHTLYALFGAPEDVAADHTLTRAAHTLMASWIRCAEAMLRRLLLIEASVFPKPNTRPLLHEKRKRTRKAIGFDADKPEAWRVSFRCFAPMERRRPRWQMVGPDANMPARRRRSIRFRSAWPLAERYEALIRVFNNPERYARRLARALHALPHRIRELFRKPEEAQHRVDDWDVFDAGAQRAWPVADTS
ncbi:hypothetical protein DSM104635_03215 [Terricaulis silvestris]|uniref:Uncharacterized protein n=2 Tax=Terricaulis silvestris TaxID=2686094 RepID=A0A6I6MSF5_9CAUL|nr:hypothetical protein DSM104635_03215 [Terricaulis silvestris]